MKDQRQDKNQKQTNPKHKERPHPVPDQLEVKQDSGSHSNLQSPALTTSSAACSQWYHGLDALLQKALIR